MTLNDIDRYLLSSSDEEHHLVSAETRMGGVRRPGAGPMAFAWRSAASAALLAENARLRAENQRWCAESESIQRVSAALLAEPRLAQVLEVVCTEARRLTGALGAAVFQLEGAEWLKLIYSNGTTPTLDRVPVGGTLSGKAMQGGNPLLVNDPAHQDWFYRADVAPRNFLAVPLRVSGRAIGVLQLANKPDDFTEDDRRIIPLFAEHAAMAIESARMNQRAQEMAVLLERERLAREIHDNLAQVLSAVKLKASEVCGLLQRGEMAQAAAQTRELQQIASEGSADAREAIFGLRSSIALEMGLLPALETYLARYRKACGVQVHLQVGAGTDLEVPTSAALQIIRIIQEALTNVRKHSGASEAALRLVQSGDWLWVTVEDYGRGFEPAAVAGRADAGAGLQIMRERAESLGGNLTIEASVGRGTRVMVSVPLSD